MIITEFAKNKICNLIKNTDKCIEYPITNKDGYGLIQGTLNGKKLHMLAHRVSYQLYNNNDNITSKDIICHHCDNPRCINPKHLFKGTHKDNSDDKVNKGRQAKGKSNGQYIDGRASDWKKHKQRNNGILTFQQVMEVRELKRKGERLIKISKILNIPYHTVKDISCGRIYKDII